MAKFAVFPFQAPRYYPKGEDRIGPDAELAKAIVEQMNAEWLEPGQSTRQIEPVWVTRQTESLLSALRNEEADMALGIGITKKGQEEFDFSKPYYTSELVLVISPMVKKLHPTGINGSKIGVRAGGAIEEFVKEKYPRAEITPYDSLDEAILALKRGEVVGVIDDKYLAAYSLDTVPGVGYLEIVPGTLGTLEVAVAVRKGEAQMIELVNKVIAATSDQYQKTFAEHEAGRFEKVAVRFTQREEKEKLAQAPRHVTIRISKDRGSKVDIYKFANLTFTLTNTGTGQSYSSSPVGFKDRTGFASAQVPPGSYIISLPRFNFRTSANIGDQSPSSVTINIRFDSQDALHVS
ncbi:MAG TPA: ABC transporter substrate-binding protein [Acidobacteriota bacterium]|nr:ABC transporter substrate-binding protein [Acidobacteriota bacterium]